MQVDFGTGEGIRLRCMNQLLQLQIHHTATNRITLLQKSIFQLCLAYSVKKVNRSYIVQTQTR